MIGTNDVATLYAFQGQSGGKPAYAEKGEPFPCRCEPASLHAISGQSIEETADTLFIAEDIAASPGDRIRYNGRDYLVKRVDALRTFSRIHHYEILARAEGA